MSERPLRRLEFDRENTLYELFCSSNDISIIQSSQTSDPVWMMALGRYLKKIRVDSHPISSNYLLYQLIERILNENHLITRPLLLILKQCVYLYPDKLVNLSFQRHLLQALLTLKDPYLKYKYVRLLRLIIADIDEHDVRKILPSTNEILDNYHQVDSSVMIVLETRVLTTSDNQLQARLNELYQRTLLEYFKSNDFDDDELIDLCQILFQINRNTSLQCLFTIPNLFNDLLRYIDYDVDTMLNWLLTPETGEKFLIFILRLVKYFAANRDEFKSQIENENYNQLSIVDMGRVFLEHLGGQRIFSCAHCDTPLTNRNELVSTRFTGATGRAFLFSRVVNTKQSAVQERMMLTGRHFVRDVCCKKCDAKLGWMYEFATEESQRYKEGRVILERALINESDGF
ncbi:unnamed protein product [Adineta ricciae]|uniref:Yippee domain-containing protein n=1 Tax=Adineta ricciae TaxID=249248 RepID=A0A815VMI1_ADIRI|nr:unnamed protein product [Adineta ricciae]